MSWVDVGMLPRSARKQQRPKRAAVLEPGRHRDVRPDLRLEGYSLDEIDL
jgi:hypothetical protein